MSKTFTVNFAEIKLLSAPILMVNLDTLIFISSNRHAKSQAKSFIDFLESFFVVHGYSIPEGTQRVKVLFCIHFFKTIVVIINQKSPTDFSISSQNPLKRTIFLKKNNVGIRRKVVYFAVQSSAIINGGGSNGDSVGGSNDFGGDGYGSGFF